MEFTDPVAIANEALRRGYTPIPLRPKAKRPATSDWTATTYASTEDLMAQFDAAAAPFEDTLNVGLALGREHGFLIDVDVDHPKAALIARSLLPATAMRSGRGDSPGSHFWYRIEADDPDLEELDRVHALRLPGQPGATIIELRGHGGQTVAPGSIHPDGDFYAWDPGSEPWGGDEGPAVVTLRKLLASVAAIGLLVTLADSWPGPGGRHAAYLALVGGMLRDADDDGAPRVHPGWGSSIAAMVRILAHMTHDRDGAGARVSETVNSTQRKILAGKRVQGWPTLAGLIGEPHVERAREMVQLIEELDGQVRRTPTRNAETGQTDADWFTGTPAETSKTTARSSEDVEGGPGIEETFEERAERLAALPLEHRDPLAERQSAWESLDLAPYLLGDLETIKPSVLLRTDGRALFYRGRTNSLYGSGGSGKTWIALHSAVEEIASGNRVLMVDFEDEPQGALGRLRSLGVDEGAVLDGAFHYVAPDEPIASMQTDRHGQPSPTPHGATNRRVFNELVKRVDPDLIIVDGITTLYSLHGLNTNDATSTDVVSRWLRNLTGGYRRTVVIIDHTSKSAQPGSDPMGSQHKIAMIQGAAIQVYATARPRPGTVGEAMLYIGKDRPGGTYEHSTPEDPSICGVVRFDSTTPGQMNLTIDPATAGTVTLDASHVRAATPPAYRPTSPAGRPKVDRKLTAATILSSLDGGPKTAKESLMATGLGETIFREVLRSLLADGRVRADRSGRSVRYLKGDG